MGIERDGNACSKEVPNHFDRFLQVNTEGSRLNVASSLLDYYCNSCITYSQADYGRPLENPSRRKSRHLSALVQNWRPMIGGGVSHSFFHYFSFSSTFKSIGARLPTRDMFRSFRVIVNSLLIWNHVYDAENAFRYDFCPTASSKNCSSKVQIWIRRCR